MTVKPMKPRQAAPVDGLRLELLDCPTSEARLRFAESFIESQIEYGAGLDDLFTPVTPLGQEVARLEAWVDEGRAASPFQSVPVAEAEVHVGFSDKLRRVYWRGQWLKFGKKQWRVIKVLLAEREAGITTGLPEDLIRERAQLKEGTRLHNLFRYHPAWKTFLVPTKPGCFKLNLP